VNPSGSGLERASKCAASCALTKASHTGEPAIKGTENHGEIEGGLVVGGDLSGLPQAVQTAMHWALKVDVEVAFAIDVEKETVRRIGSRIERAYGELGPTEIALTIDAIIYKASGCEVWDWKSRERVTSAKSNLQIRAGVVAVMFHEQLTKVHGGIGYLDNGETDEADFDMFDVAVFFSDMRAMLKSIHAAQELVASGGTPDVSAGPWCKYCPAMPYCPAHTRLAMTMIGELDYISKEIAFFSPDQVSKAWDTYKRLETILERAGESLRLRIGQSVIPRPGNKRLAMVEMPGRSTFDKDAALGRLKELGGSTEGLMKKGKPYFQVKEVNWKPESVPADHE
jgi:hypothetical protein